MSCNTSSIKKAETRAFRSHNEIEGKENIEQVQLRLLVSNRIAGAIIGKKGLKIQQLRTEFNIEIHIPAFQLPERVCTIIGHQSSIIQVFKNIIPQTQEFLNGVNKCELRFLIQRNQAGPLIGKQGVHIKEMRNLFNTKIRIFDECPPISKHRVLSISGKPCDCVDLIEAIIKRIVQNPMPDIPEKNSRFFDDLKHFNLNRNLQGRPIFEQPPVFHTIDSFYSNHSINCQKNSAVSLTISSNNFLTNDGQPHILPSNTFNLFRSDVIFEPVSTVQFPIPPPYINVLNAIQSQITQIQIDSRANITIHQDLEGRYILTLTGTEQQISAAQNYLKNCLRRIQIANHTNLTF